MLPSSNQTETHVYENLPLLLRILARVLSGVAGSMSAVSLPPLVLITIGTRIPAVWKPVGGGNRTRLERNEISEAGQSGDHATMIELLVTYPGLVFVGLSLLVVLDIVSGNLPPAALLPFALGTIVAVIFL